MHCNRKLAIGLILALGSTAAGAVSFETGGGVSLVDLDAYGSSTGFKAYADLYAEQSPFFG